MAVSMGCFKKLRQYVMSVLALMAVVSSAWAFSPVDGDFKTILQAKSEAPTVWRYQDNPSIFVFDFPSLTAQGRSFNRVMQLTEQQLSEPYPRALTNEELGKYIESLRRTQADFAFGHDILVSEFVQFFSLAERDKVALNPEEIAIRDFLTEQGLIRNWRGFYQALKPNTVILSIPQTQERRENEPKITIGARYAILLHELAHGEFYANPFYNVYCHKFWNDTLSESQREAFKKFLSNYGYSTFSEELLINEMQAYLMFTPDAASFSARKLGVSESELEGMREAFRKGRPPVKLPLTILKGELQ